MRSGVVDDLHHDRQVFRKPENFGGVHAAVGAETHHAAQHGGAGHAALAGFQHNHLVQRPSFVVVAFADEDPQQFGFFRQSHGMVSFFVGNDSSRRSGGLFRVIGVSRRLLQQSPQGQAGHQRGQPAKVVNAEIAQASHHSGRAASPRFKHEGRERGERPHEADEDNSSRLVAGGPSLFQRRQTMPNSRQPNRLTATVPQGKILPECGCTSPPNP